MNRRSFLTQGSLSASSLLLSPLVQRLQAEAAGAKKLPQRVLFIVEGNGVPPQHVQPKEIVRPKYGSDKLIDQPLAACTFPEPLEPLAPFKDRLTIIQGLSGKIARGSHSCNYGALGCYPPNKGPMGETIDAALAKALPGIFPHVGLGMTDRIGEGVVYNISAWDKGKSLPVQCRPDLAYRSLFGSVADGGAKSEFEIKNNVLDFMAGDVRRLQGNLAGEEKQKLDSYLNAFESLRRRQSRLNEIESTLRKQGPVTNDKYTSAVETDRLDAQFDLAAAALICGLTNVAVIASGCGDPYFGVSFKGLGINIGKHGIGHGGSDTGRDYNTLMTIIRRFHLELTARLAKKLQAVPEGDGTMLDNTLIIYLSDFGESHHPWLKEWPMVLIGNLGGKLKAGNRFLEFPKYGANGHRTTANFYLSLLHAAGAPRDKFGLADPELKDLDQTGPLAELLV